MAIPHAPLTVGPMLARYVSSFWPSATTDVVESPKHASTWAAGFCWSISTRHFWNVLIAAWLICCAEAFSCSYWVHCAWVRRAFCAPPVVDVVVLVLSVLLDVDSPPPPPQPAAASTRTAATAASMRLLRFTSPLSARTAPPASS